MQKLEVRALKSVETALRKVDLGAFANRLTGELIRPGDEAYDEARAVWNGMIDRHPALVTRCVNTDDVIASVNFAREHDLLLSVRGGGHNAAGYATNDGGLVIDLSPMNQVQVDPEARTVRVGGGATLGDLDRATQAHGLVVPAGVVSETGVGGLTLSGGYGWLRNKHGLTSDNLIAAEVVTAGGRLLRASEEEHNDLFWGLRGGGGNFGIVTTFEFRAHPLGPEVWMTAAFHDGRHMVEVLQYWRDYCATAPDEVATLAACGLFPMGAEIFPEQVHGLPYVLLVGVYAGPAEEGERAMQPLRDFRQPLVDFSGTTTWLEAQRFFDEDYPAGELCYYWKSANLYELGDAAIERIAELAVTQPSPLTTTDLWHVGGAIRRMDENATAFVGRQASFLFNVEANWKNPKDNEMNLAWARAFVEAMREFSDGSRYLNFPGLDEEGDAVIQDTFGSKHERLVALKNKYDPGNLFRMNSNIKPTV
jgi:FAD/FMN-containing dehydrogenase